MIWRPLRLLNVDGAGDGGSVVLSGSGRPRQMLGGLERAASVAIGGFEWLGQMDDCGVLLVRERRHLVQSWFVGAEDAELDGEMAAFRNYGIESTGVVKLWFTLRVLGLDTVERMNEHSIALAERAEVEIRRLSFWEILSPASMGIVGFRYAPPEVTCADKLDSINVAIARQVSKEGSAATVVRRIRLRGKTALRVCLIGSDWKETDVHEVVKGLALAARCHSGCRYERKT